MLSIIRRLQDPVSNRVGATVELSVPGRRTGTARHVTLFPVEVEGSSYLMSQYGDADWVLNLRAAGGGQLVRKGRAEAFTAVEVDGDERDRVLATFRAKAPKPFRRDFERLPDAADHPTFRVVPIL